MLRAEQIAAELDNAYGLIGIEAPAASNVISLTSIWDQPKTTGEALSAQLKLG